MPRQPLWRQLLVTTLLRPSLIWAEGGSERAALARLNHKKALEHLIRDAELQGDPDARFRFQYAWLRDLKQIRFAIEEYIEALIRAAQGAATSRRLPAVAL